MAVLSPGVPLGIRVGIRVGIREVSGGAMLLADMDNVESSLRLRMLQIREREFDFFMNNVRSIGRLSTVLAGFGHAGLIYTKYIDHNLCGEREILCAELSFPFFNVIALGCAIATMWGCVLLATMAPGVALHGHHNVYSQCVDMVRGGGGHLGDGRLARHSQTACTAAATPSAAPLRPAPPR